MEQYINNNLILNNLIDSVYDAICVIDQSYKVLLWNASAERIYGISKSKIIGSDLRDVFPNALLPSVIDSETSYINHFHQPSEGKRMVITAKPVYMDGKLIGAISADRDVSELSELSEKLSLVTDNLDKLKEEIEHLYEDKFSFSEIIGASPLMLEAVEMAKAVAKSTLSVLLTGESGTGKELFARALHERSGRKGLFVPINCSAIPKTLLESELFGYIEGAFTGAMRGGKAGLFEIANDGTLFLDEIGDMPMSMQSKLLRVLEDGKVQRIGSVKFIDTDVRIIAATNHNLREQIDKKRFRSDLFYRLNAVHIKLPALRERKEDIELLVYEFTRRYCSERAIDMIDYDEHVLKKLIDYRWDGNVRELKNMIERFVIMCNNEQSKMVGIEMLPDEVLGQLSSNSDKVGLIKAIEQFEKSMIERTLIACNGNRAKCAKRLGIPRSTLYFKLDKYQILDGIDGVSRS
ncbi:MULTISPECIES: sigma-54-dependent Fis family transcriptional regulator [unclassified Fusibacter]|uniref:sigma-54 interaction domain-containing protein n=1 Tax=unclassified Fusibacter TaxID=2624464 RepID=UPI0013E96CCB|nr:sigma 54-interacting transcriptional regulator [Fusibacter sp. A1]MCK8059581.1 sigma 54-interacting transcriptional regulator [Fusibacter sp. A2]NPE21382.1 sigma 54-interacting transcriptional regulator [Fusibacter sp. A1]